MSDSVTRIDLIRHGEVATSGLFCAHDDEPLSENGWRCLEQLTKDYQPQLVVSSPSRRCRSFASEFAANADLPLLLNDDFRELDFGDWLGRSSADLWQEESALMYTLLNDPLNYVAPNGEAMSEFIRRVQLGWDDLLTAQQGKHLALFCHSGVIRVLLAMLLDIPYRNTVRFDIAYASATRVTVFADRSCAVNAVATRCLSDD